MIEIVSRVNSCNGHSCYAEYIGQSNKPLQELRETHFKENDFLGSLCSEYENNKVELLSFYNFLLRYNSLEKSQSIIGDEYYHIILEDYFYEHKHWWKTYYSRATYYRRQEAAINAFFDYVTSIL